MAEDRVTQEQSIKDRKKQLYDVDAPLVPEGSSRPFKEFLRDTPAAPLAGGVKAMLWAVGVVVVLLLAAALFKGLGGPKRPAKAAWEPTINAHRLA
jgi:hypothetical protein